MESFGQNLFIDRFIFNNIHITISPCFTFIPKTGVRLKQGQFLL